MTKKPLTFLGIESSCDETAVAVVSSERKILSQCLYSQLDEHAPFGGVVPEIAARAHLQKLPSLINHALDQANITLQGIDAIAATTGPGLIGGVLVGMCAAKAMAFSLNIPFIPVNHLVGHALSARLNEDVEFPFILLLVSGGHSQFVLVQSPLSYIELGATCDDAVGETFDKVAQVMGLSYPGGPAIERLAQQGNAQAFAFPKPFFKSTHCDLSFSGLKTAVREVVMNHNPLSQQSAADIAASFQKTVADILVDRSLQAIKTSKIHAQNTRHFVVAGGVAANHMIRHELSSNIESQGLKCVFPPVELCTDNAAMIAWAGLEIMLYKKSSFRDYSASARPRWPLSEMEQQL